MSISLLAFVSRAIALVTPPAVAMGSVFLDRVSYRPMFIPRGFQYSSNRSPRKTTAIAKRAAAKKRNRMKHRAALLNRS